MVSLIQRPPQLIVQTGYIGEIIKSNETDVEKPYRSVKVHRERGTASKCTGREAQRGSVQTERHGVEVYRQRGMTWKG